MFKHLMNNVEYKGRNYYVSTNDTFDAGLETMIFMLDKDGKTDWRDLYCERYTSAKTAKNRHEYIVNHIGEFIESEE